MGGAGLQLIGLQLAGSCTSVPIALLLVCASKLVMCIALQCNPSLAWSAHGHERCFEQNPRQDHVEPQLTPLECFQLACTGFWCGIGLGRQREWGTFVTN